MSISSVLHQCPPLGAPGSNPAPEATLERGDPRESRRELAVDVCNRHLVARCLALMASSPPEGKAGLTRRQVCGKITPQGWMAFMRRREEYVSCFHVP
jgi:hypothetical protein